MALETPDERSSAINLGLPWRGMFPVPDGFLNANNRAHVAGLFGAFIAPVITSTVILQLPIDYQLAGEPQFHERYRTFEIPPKRTTLRPHSMTAGVRRLSAGAPSFTTQTTKRGYD